MRNIIKKNIIMTTDIKELMNESIGTLKLSFTDDDTLVESIFSKEIKRIVSELRTGNYKNNKRASELAQSLCYDDYQRYGSNSIISQYDSQYMYLVHFDLRLDWIKRIDILIFDDEQYDPMHADNIPEGVAFSNDSFYTDYDYSEKCFSRTMILLHYPDINLMVGDNLDHEFNHLYQTHQHYASNRTIYFKDVEAFYDKLILDVSRTNQLKADSDDYYNEIKKTLTGIQLWNDEYVEFIKDNLDDSDFIYSIILYMVYFLNKGEIAAHKENLYDDFERYFKCHKGISRAILDTMGYVLKTRDYELMCDASYNYKIYNNIKKVIELFDNELPDLTIAKMYKNNNFGELLRNIGVKPNKNNHLYVESIWKKLLFFHKRITKQVRKIYTYCYNTYAK